eukprot:7980456-Pyramimonas_sp.AAC.1
MGHTVPYLSARQRRHAQVEDVGALAPVQVLPQRQAGRQAERKAGRQAGRYVLRPRLAAVAPVVQ